MHFLPRKKGLGTLFYSSTATFAVVKSRDPARPVSSRTSSPRRRACAVTARSRRVSACLVCSCALSAHVADCRFQIFVRLAEWRSCSTIWPLLHRNRGQTQGVDGRTATVSAADQSLRVCVAWLLRRYPGTSVDLRAAERTARPILGGRGP